MLVRDDDTDMCGAAEREGGGGEASASAFVARRERKKLGEKKDTPDARTLATPRAWQITERDGRRTQVWRTPANAGLYAMLRPPWRRSRRDTEARGRSTSAYTPNARTRRSSRLCERILGGGDARLGAPKAHRWLSVEPFTHATRPVPRETLELLCSAGDVFSPNELEAVSLVVRARCRSCAAARAAGAKIVCVRRGRRRRRARRETGETWSVPAFFSEDQSGALADVTGCGNAFCGGFIAGLASGESLDRAACWGSAAASVVAEHVGVRRRPPATRGRGKR